MARARPDDTSASRQLTLDDWVQMLNEATEPATKPGGETEAVTELADVLAPRLAQELSHRIPPSLEPAPTARLLTLDQLVAELPPAKRPQTWKRWLYERTRRGEIPGCVKLGGMLFFDRDPALAWLRAGASTTR
jgi:hypothetical protein